VHFHTVATDVMQRRAPRDMPEKRRAYARNRTISFGIPVLLVWVSTMTYLQSPPTVSAFVTRWLSWLLGFGVVYLPITYLWFLRAFDKHWPDLK
jgi:hypothetical protein